MHVRPIPHKLAAIAVMAAWSALAIQSGSSAPLNLRDTPIFLNESVAPLNMLVVGRDHRLYYEAYNDASDLDGDGYLDIRFKPSITYFGNFDSQTCYTYASNRFSPAGGASQPGNTCPTRWSGNWLNYMTTARIDALRKVLYGGRRIVDTASETVIERSHIPQDAHSWGKAYTSVAADGYDLTQYAPLPLPTAGRRHLFANTTLLSDGSQLPRFRVALDRTEPGVWEWVSKERPVAGGNTISGSISPTDYIVRVQVCVPGSDFTVGDENDDSGCRRYPDGNYKPTGLLHNYGESDAMMFGLITGSYQKNIDGGVLRKAMGSFRNEVTPSNGTFTNVDPGIVRTLNGLRTTGFGGSFEYTDPADNCGWITNGPISSGRCRMWGNPIGEMMYEALRYYAGKGSATAAFAINATGNPDAALGLSRATWDNPYGTGKPACAKPFMTVVSDTPSFDSDQVPGSPFASFSGDMPSSLNLSTLGQTIWNGETGGSADHFIGQSGTGPLSYDGSPSPKTVTSLGNVRGLAPEEPTKQGSFSSAAVAFWGNTRDVNSVAGVQRVQTFAVALASPLPRIEIPVAGRKVTLVPFAKSVGGFGIVGTQGAFQPTNQIVDFYIESMADDMSSGVFRVNFEDVEQGADHDMDAIVRYAWTVNGDGTVTITLDSIYAAGGIIQHMGYVIDGTNRDGTYLEVRDLDTAAGSDPDYFLDTTPTMTAPGAGWNDGQPLPLTATRTFTPGTTPGATVLEDPLWFAAKWGGFADSNNNGRPDETVEWDADPPNPVTGKRTPDNYFLVTNALTLKSQLGKAFDSIIERTGSISAAAVNASVIREDTLVFNAEFTSSLWSGNLKAWSINTDGSIGEFRWSAANELPEAPDRRIATQNSDGTPVQFTWAALDAARRAQLAPEGVETKGQFRLDYLRGDRSKEIRQADGEFRNRDPASVLGAFIYSAPLFVGASTARYPDSIESAAFSSFKATTKERPAMVYIGGNAGMLHAFNAATGVEEWAFIPRQAFDRLKPMTDVNYQFRSTVDGSPAVGDVFWSGSWKTILVTGLGQGGQGLFTMDVTDPRAATQSAVPGKYLWDFTDAQDVDLGFTMSRPVVTKLANGKWVVILGNGYNNTVADGRASATGNAVLYILDAQTGSLLRKISTNAGMSADPLGQARPNGLGSPAVVDLDRDGVSDFAYAGDLFGNLWKFDLRDPSASNWKVAYQDGSANPLPFYVARDGSGKRQPITSRPNIGRGAFGEGLVVYFGTGKFLEPADRVLGNLSTQSFYSIRDNNTMASTDLVPGRAQLTRQTIDVETTVTVDGRESGIRVTSNNAIGGNRGWYMDLISPGNVFRGEMQVTDSVLRDERIVFTTLVPNEDPCGYGGSSYIMILDALTGGVLNNTFDLNGDDVFTNDDKYDDGTSQTAASGLQYENGIATRPTIVTNGVIDVLMLQGSGDGNVNDDDEDAAAGCLPGAPCTKNVQAPPGFYGRQSWRQLR